LADWIEAKGRTLRTIYLTHGHPDHFFGLTFLLQRFPQARAIARPNVVRAMRTAAAPDVVANNWSRRWPGQIPERLTIAAELHAERFELEGHEKWNKNQNSIADPNLLKRMRAFLVTPEQHRQAAYRAAVPSSAAQAFDPT
jgi:metal-dependent hydrolase (beta-lactamase superfamily II)